MYLIAGFDVDDFDSALDESRGHVEDRAHRNYRDWCLAMKPEFKPDAKLSLSREKAERVC